MLLVIRVRAVQSSELPLLCPPSDDVSSSVMDEERLRPVSGMGSVLSVFFSVLTPLTGRVSGQQKACSADFPTFCSGTVEQVKEQDRTNHPLPSVQSLRSSNTYLLVRPSGIISNFTSQAFSVSASSTWNSLPTHIRCLDKLSTFKRQLKSHLFQSAFAV